MLLRWLFGTFGAVALPWHATVLQGLRWAVLAEALACIGLLTAFFLRRNMSGQTPGALTMAVWLPIGTLPVITIHGVGPDLQGARYLYLPSMGWAGLLAFLASVGAVAGLARRAQTIGVSIILVTYVVGLRVHITPWLRAGELRDRVESAATQDPSVTACRTIQLADLPDNIEGAYVFRNGVGEAFGRDLGIRVSPDAPPECSFRWDDQRGAFIPRKPARVVVR